MKFVTFYSKENLRVGAIVIEKDLEYVIDLHSQNPSIPSNLICLLEMGEKGLKLIRDAINKSNKQARIPINDVILAPPIPKPSKIVCLGLNYQDHASDPSKKPEFPTIFAKYNNSLIGNGSAIKLPKISNQTDYEAEMAVIIGKRGKNIPVSDALEYVAGYTAFNDVSARDIQTRTSQWLQGKTLDTFGPMGPCLVTMDEIDDIGNLDISLVLNSQIMQKSNTKNLIFSVQEIVSYLSEIMTLEVGDVISTGTPGGVGALQNPPVFLKEGDIVEVYVEGVGRLINVVSK